MGKQDINGTDVTIAHNTRKKMFSSMNLVGYLSAVWTKVIV